MKRPLMILTLLLMPNLVIANNDIDSYVSETNIRKSKKITKSIRIPELTWDETEIVYQEIRKSLDDNVDIYKLLLLDYPKLRLLRNEIFAKKGKIFKSYYLKKYFNDLGYKLTKDEIHLSKKEKENFDLISSVEYAKKTRKYYGYYFNDDYLKSSSSNEMSGKVLKHNKNEDLSEWIEFLSTGKVFDLKKEYYNRLIIDENGVEHNYKYLGYYENYELFSEPKMVLIRGWDDDPMAGPRIKNLKGAYDYDGNLLFESNNFFNEVGFDKETDSFLTYAQNGCCGVTDINASIVKSNGTTVVVYDNICGYANFVKPLNSEASLLSLGTIAKGSEFCEGGIQNSFGRLIFYDKKGLILDQEFEGDIFSLYPSDVNDKAKVVLVSNDLLYFSKRNEEFVIQLSKQVPFTNAPPIEYLDLPKYNEYKQENYVRIEEPTIMWLQDMPVKCTDSEVVVDKFSGESTLKNFSPLYLCAEKDSMPLDVPWEKMNLDCSWYGCDVGFFSEYIMYKNDREQGGLDYANDFTYHDLNKVLGTSFEIKKVSDQYFLFYEKKLKKIAAFGDRILNDFVKRGIYP